MILNSMLLSCLSRSTLACRSASESGLGVIGLASDDPSFDLSEPEAFRRDVPKAEVHVLDASHFALDTNADEIAALVRKFMKAQK
jgi:hypothetical protein